MKVLLTGGLGYIGSHISVELLNNNYDVIIVDNLINSEISVLNRIELITNKKVKFYQIDINDYDSLDKVFKLNKIDYVIHLAGMKAVNESINKPLLYYYNNISGTINLCKIMNNHNVNNLIFSSSATVYGNNCKPPYTEDMEIGGCTNPYGQTKLMIEQILNDLVISDKKWKITSLRYFNPIGAHESGLIGEDPKGIPNNLLPYINKVVNNELKHLNIFGNDYDTDDGTCIRDYIHIVDLAKGHIKALENLNSGYEVYNLGTGKGYSVLEVINTYKKVNKVEFICIMEKRREGDLPISYANVNKANKKLNWKAEYDLERMCKDSYHFVNKKVLQK